MNIVAKGLTSLAVCFAVLAGGFASPFSASAAEMNVKVQINDELVSFPDVQPYVDANHAAQVPIRFVTDKLGYNLHWEKEGDQFKVTLNNNVHTITLTSGKKEALIDNSTVDMETYADFQNGRVFVPLRFIAETSNIPLQWDETSKLAILNKDGNQHAPVYQTFTATAYSADPSENGGYGANDYMGNPLQLGTVAVDPSVIPLGTKLFIEGYDFNGLPAGGMYAYATDTGSSIKGNRVDIFIPGSKSSLKRFGMQNIKVYQLPN